ncbi:4-hydroxyphenylpyruvate dioxygenase [Aspergillus leporis]|jgi:sugar phosphate isomerase/epimerase|uniref:4-hydroxyphenylpyruvate dioxygenase n=1 Tax=Aspergillus leporis TaxID=41062 RepID=A0A5N5WRE0_9EURO|nr:4-hydroxyphenylpyruvate dioxygenase [Aspergillus leporis]
MFSNKLAISTISLGQHPSHSLDRKLTAAAQAGYAGVEIVYSDLQTYSQSHGLSIADGAVKIKATCDDNKLKILSLAPFENYEGDSSPLIDRLQRAAHWIETARILQSPYLQVPGQFKADAIGDEVVIVSELRQLADLGSSKQPLVSIAYEPMSWSTYYSTWESSLRLVEAVNRPNFGLCLDTFHLATKVWADPFAVSGKIPDADQSLQETLCRFARECPLEKVFYIQLSDGVKFDPPFSEAHPWYLEGEAPQFTWSKHARPFPLETHLGGYLPVTEIVRAWIGEKGFAGWTSLEIFDERMRQKNSRPESAALRGIDSWKKIQLELQTPTTKL